MRVSLSRPHIVPEVASPKIWRAPSGIAHGRAMDPYRILRVERGCTREEVKEAFRAKVVCAHPDRGGEQLTFVQLRAAYEQILRELDRRPRAQATHVVQPPRDAGTAKPVDPIRFIGPVLHHG